MEIFQLENGYHISCRKCSFLTAINVNSHVFLGEDEGMNKTYTLLYIFCTDFKCNGIDVINMVTKAGIT